MPPASARPSLRDEQKALTRCRLIDAAKVVFARRGFRGASVDEIAREAGATTGALYSNFAGKEDLFLELFEETLAADLGDYAAVFAGGETPSEKGRAAADHWMQILHERPDYFPLFIEFWAYAIREPSLRKRFAKHLATIRTANGRLVAEGAEAQGFSLSAEMADRLGLVIAALGNGIALEKLADPDAVPDSLYGDTLVLIFQALSTLARQAQQATEQGAEHD